ncbi:hypothetical protein AB6805_01850 [Chitinophaga sp. RCC_12]|uniref:hypothetical protein n=1 Tax=Chitinophaga sp. RCC_12 TaxID=3239226 RepID=UPI003523EF87
MNEKAYKDWLLEIKNKVRQAQLKAVANFNIALIKLYWEPGKEIVLRQTKSKIPSFQSMLFKHHYNNK